MRLIGKIELPPQCLTSPEKNGIVAQKVGIDLKVYDAAGELGNDKIIAQDFAWMTHFGLENEAGEQVIIFEGTGAQKVDGVTQLFPPGHEHAGYSVPNPGYVLDGPGISALEHSNGFRMMVNMKHYPQGYYTAFGTVKGLPVQWKIGDTFRVGRAKPKPPKPQTRKK